MHDDDTPKLLYEEAEKMGLQPQWLTNYGLFKITWKGKQLYLFYSYNTINNQLSSYLAKNKHITRTILQDNNLPNIPYALPQSVDEIATFLAEHTVIIAKPTLGTHSRNVFIIKSMEDIKGFNFMECIFEKYIVGKEYRYLILNGSVIAVHRKYYETPINNPDTVKRISYPKKEWNKRMIDIALKVTKIMDLTYSAVDFMVNEGGTPFILEVNSSPGTWFFNHPSEGPSVNVAKMLLETMIKQI